MNKGILSLIVIFILVNSQLSNANYFTPSYSGNPYCPMSFLVTSISFEDSSLKNGDEIGVFDKQVCVGSYVYNGDSIFGFPASMNDPSTNSIGFISGHAISFKIWIKNTNQLIHDVKIVFRTDLDTLFKPYGIAIVELIGEKDPIKPKVIAGQSFSVPENSPAKFIFGKVMANLPVGATYNYKIQSGNIKDAFSIDSLEGTIYVNQSGSLDFEKINIYTLLIRLYAVTDTSIYDSSLVNINITDVKEFTEVNKLMVDTAFVGTQFFAKIALSDSAGDAITLSHIEMPLWLTYRQDNNNSLILEGIPNHSDQGESSAILNYTIGNKIVKSIIDLKVLANNNPLSFSIGNNPSYGNYTLFIGQLEEDDLIHITVFNLSGAIVYNETIVSNSTQLSVPFDLTGKSKNTYLVEVKTNKSRFTGKLILL
jgi:hypothetical protein